MSELNGHGPEEHEDMWLRNLMAENYTLRTWVAGLVAECEDCRRQASEWLDKTGIVHETTYPAPP